MNQFIDFILQFGNLNQQQIDLVLNKAKELELRKDEYFIEAGKVFRYVGFIVEGIVRICYYNNKGEEITKIFIEENHLLFSLKNIPSTEYIQATIGAKTNVLDVLINNAGISGGLPQTALDTSIDKFKEVFETNLYGVVRVTQAFIDLLRNSPEPRIVNVSSSMASLTLHNDPNWKYYTTKGAVYLPSKTALNMYTVNLAYELRDTAFKVNMVDPGFIKTDFNNHRGTGTVEEAGRRIVKYAIPGNDGPTGKFFSEEYNPVTEEIPW